MKERDLSDRILAATYQIERKLGSGGMGQVYLVRHVRTGGLFALKTLLLERADVNSEIYRRFQDEARTVSALRHPNIVQVTDFDQDSDGNPFIVMEYLEGEDLAHRLARVGKLDVAQLKELVEQIGSALQAAHDNGVVHRDVKPQNIFLCKQASPRGTREVAKILDFGVSKIRRSKSQMTRDHTVMGTPEYMSPEAATGENTQIDGRSDQFSFAVILYQALSGQEPFAAEQPLAILWRIVNFTPPPLRDLVPEVSAVVADAITRAMSKKKEDRFLDMNAFISALCELDLNNRPYNRGEAFSEAEVNAKATLSRAQWYRIGTHPSKKHQIVGSVSIVAIVLLCLLILAIGKRSQKNQVVSPAIATIPSVPSAEGQPQQNQHPLATGPPQAADVTPPQPEKKSASPAEELVKVGPAGGAEHQPSPSLKNNKRKIRAFSAQTPRNAKKNGPLPTKRPDILPNF